VLVGYDMKNVNHSVIEWLAGISLACGATKLQFFFWLLVPNHKKKQSTFPG
jgi:hypothetical protein